MEDEISLERERTNKVESFKYIGTMIANIVSFELEFNERLKKENHAIARLKNEEKLQGHLMRVLAFNYEPYSFYMPSKDGPGGVVTLLESLDKRIMDALSAALDFTYEVRSPNTSDIGYPNEDGSWTGILGTLYNKDIDFTTAFGSSRERASVIDLKNTVNVGQLTIISLKPSLLPEYLVFFRTFTGIVWILVILSILIWGASARILQKWRSSFSSNKVYSLNQEIFYGLSMLLGNPVRQPTNITSQMLVCWWLIFSLLMTTAFKSSLVALLTVEGKTLPINSFSDLVKQVNWAWGIDQGSNRGLMLSFFKESKNPDIRFVYKHLGTVGPEEGLARVLKGHYSFLIGKDRAKPVIESKYTNRYRENPFYFSKENYKIAPAIGWGFRKGAPFTSRFFKAISHLWEGGISDRWFKEVQDSNNRKIREKYEKEKFHAIDTEETHYKVITWQTGPGNNTYDWDIFNPNRWALHRFTLFHLGKTYKKLLLE
ncbi:probable glutamate receptor [Palaemon carinicauda]|uniref:probable glutamate receptor n=1 Tax=Palaemon carinicauda TaxID=392227 RepID=UPI0035B58923